MKLNELTIKQAAEGLRKQEFSITELVSDCLAAIEKENRNLRAYLNVFEDALDEAKKLDKSIGQIDKLPPLFGIPIAIKDNILIGGKPCTAGSKIIENYIASYDATVIQKLKNHGAIFLGKTNLDEFAMGSSTENSSFGPTKNPHDPKRVPGGSSGGSAAAVAANLALAALGSDTGGSIRQPASFCGIVGLKPTYGAVSRHGLIAMASSLDQIGPMTKTVEDAALLFEAIAGEDNFDSTASKNLEFRISNLEFSEDSFKNLRVGVPKEYFGAGLDPEVERIIKYAIRKIEEAGFIIKDISLPHSEYALPAYYIVVPSEVSANLARYDGIRYGNSEFQNPKSEIRNLFDVYAKTRAKGLGTEVKRRIMLGTYALSAGYYDAYYLKAQKARSLIRCDFENALGEVDVILGPTTPTPAFKLGERSDNPLQMYLADIYTVAVNLAGVPAISIPAGSIEKDGKKLPVGLQLIGGWFEEKKLLSLAAAIEKILKY
jgi:aspartyl-tRNA(Asn)/glutamyl-tRNA(Gln) amidotransferase subunit A